MSDRDHFEARAAEKLRLPVEVIQSARNGESYLHAFDSMNVMQPLNGWWDWWQASREALKAEQGDDSWIACAERMPNPKTGVMVGCWFGREWAVKWATYLPYHPDAHKSGFLMPGGSWTPSHWMSLPAPPSQPHSIDTTPNQYDALGKGEGK